MAPIEHLNAFCVLFAKLKEICESGPQRKDSQEAKDVIKKMYGHYPFLNDEMVKYMDTFTGALVSMGFNFDEMTKVNKVSVDGLDASEEVKISGKFSYASVVDANQNGKIYNYNEHSKPYNKLSPEDFQILRHKTIDNIKKEQMMMASGQRPRAPQPKTWSLPDSARDW